MILKVECTHTASQRVLRMMRAPYSCPCVAAVLMLAGLRLTIKRLMLLNVTAIPPTDSTSAPKLLPLGLFTVPVSHLSLHDVILSVPVPVFEQYLSFFREHLVASQSKDASIGGMHTVSACSACK
jgi:hypothetical protein